MKRIKIVNVLTKQVVQSFPNGVKAMDHFLKLRGKKGKFKLVING